VSLHLRTIYLIWVYKYYDIFPIISQLKYLFFKSYVSFKKSRGKFELSHLDNDSIKNG
jgi:hypothetical protein